MDASEPRRRTSIPRRRRAWLLAVVAVVAALAVAPVGCGSDDEPGTGPDSARARGQVLIAGAVPSGALRFEPEALSARAGRVTIEMPNPSAVPHAVGIKGKGLDEQGKTVGKGGLSTVSADLEPGTYSFYCPVGSHEAAGMRGELRIR